MKNYREIREIHAEHVEASANIYIRDTKHSS